MRSSKFEQQQLVSTFAAASNSAYAFFFRRRRQTLACFVLCGFTPEVEREARSSQFCGVLTHQNIRSGLRSGPGP